MRHWLFHPLIFYPLTALLAVLFIAISLQPQSWPRSPAPIRAERAGEWLVIQGAGFNSPAAAPDREMTVVRDILGRPQTLRIAERGGPGQPAPEDDGVRVLLSAEDAAALAGRPLTVEVSYNPLSVNSATSLAVSLRGEGPSQWVSQAAPPQPATLRFRLPAQSSVNAIGLRALSTLNDQAYGLEITRIRITPHA
jgi:hypothetical protein